MQRRPLRIWNRAIERNNRSVFAEQSHQLALNPDPIGGKDAHFVGRIGRFERYGSAAAAKPMLPVEHALPNPSRHHPWRTIAVVAAFVLLAHPAHALPRIGDFSLNVTNRLTAAYVLSRGLAAFTPSFDLDAAQLVALCAAGFGAWAEAVGDPAWPG